MKNFLIITTFLVLPVVAYGGIEGKIPSNTDLGLPSSPITQKQQILDVVAGIVQVTYWIFFAVATIMFIFAAYTYVTAGDNAENVKKAHKMLIWGAVAVVVALLAVGMTTIIKSFLESPGVGGSNNSPTILAPAGGGNPYPYQGSPTNGSGFY